MKRTDILLKLYVFLSERGSSVLSLMTFSELARRCRNDSLGATNDTGLIDSVNANTVHAMPARTYSILHTPSGARVCAIP